MPYIHIYALPRAADVKAKSMARITDVIAQECSVGKESIHIIWHDAPPENIAKGGVTVAEARTKNPA